MSGDLFEIRGVNIKIKVGDDSYQFSDPPLPNKIMLHKKMRSLKEEELGREEYILAMHELNKEQIKLYLPDLPDEVLVKMGEFSMQALLNKIIDLIGVNFGATVEKIEKK